MVRIIVSGASGRMGQRIIRLALLDKEIELTGAVESPGHPSIGANITEKVKLSDNLNKIIGQSDVLIEFTTPPATISHLEIATMKSLPMVIGTTGFHGANEKKLLDMSSKIPCVLSSNMSLGVNLLFKIVDESNKVLKDYDQEIVEIHHGGKRDAPSGTARRLAEILKGTSDKSYVYGRQGTPGPRPKKEIGIHAVRAGDVVGEHTVIFAGTGERLELIHRAHSRDTFAMGAIRAAKWIVGKPSGIYSMQDVLGL